MLLTKINYTSSRKRLQVRKIVVPLPLNKSSKGFRTLKLHTYSLPRFVVI